MFSGKRRADFFLRGQRGGGAAAAAAVAAPPPRRPRAVPAKKNRLAVSPQKKIGAPTPEKKNLTENAVFRSFSSIFEELRENGHQIRNLREKLRI